VPKKIEYEEVARKARSARLRLTYPKYGLSDLGCFGAPYAAAVSPVFAVVLGGW
jgi:hypothetical protein